MAAAGEGPFGPRWYGLSSGVYGVIRIGRRSEFRPIQVPRSWNPLQLVLSAIVKLDRRTCNKFFDQRRNQGLARSGQSLDPSACVDRDPDQLSPASLAFAGVNGCPNLDPDPMSNRLRPCGGRR